MYHDKKLSPFELDDLHGKIPDNYLNKVVRGRMAATAVYDRVDQSDMLRLVSITALTGNWLEIVWIYFPHEAPLVEKSDLIRYLIRCEIYRMNGELKGVFCEIHEEEAPSEQRLRHLLLMVGMEVSVSGSNTYEFTLSQITHRTLLEKTAGRMECRSLGSVENEIIEELERMIQEDERPTPLPPLINWDAYLQEESLICLKKGRPCGLLLFSAKGKYIVIDCAYVTDKMALSVMIGNAVGMIEKKYGHNQAILVPVLLNKTAEIVKGLVPDASRGKLIEGVMWLQH